MKLTFLLICFALTDKVYRRAATTSHRVNGLIFICKNTRDKWNRHSQSQS